MKKLSRLFAWGGVFAVTVTLAIGLSLLALRVRASVDARRRCVYPQTGAAQATQVVCPMFSSGSSDPVDAQGCWRGAQGNETICPSQEDCCEGPWGVEPVSSLPQAAPGYPNCH